MNKINVQFNHDKVELLAEIKGEIFNDELLSQYEKSIIAELIKSEKEYNITPSVKIIIDSCLFNNSNSSNIFNFSKNFSTPKLTIEINNLSYKGNLIFKNFDFISLTNVICDEISIDNTFSLKNLNLTNCIINSWLKTDVDSIDNLSIFNSTITFNMDSPNICNNVVINKSVVNELDISVNDEIMFGHSNFIDYSEINLGKSALIKAFHTVFEGCQINLENSSIFNNHNSKFISTLVNGCQPQSFTLSTKHDDARNILFIDSINLIAIGCNNLNVDSFEELILKDDKYSSKEAKYYIKQINKFIKKSRDKKLLGGI